MLAPLRGLFWLLTGGLVVGCSASTPTSSIDDGERRSAQTSKDVLLTFEERAAPVGDILPHARNHGTRRLRTYVVTQAGGRVVRTDGHQSGYAARFPTHTEGPDAPAAMLLLRARFDETDFLDPGAKAFAFGADVLLDAPSIASSQDDGDNLMQRGLFADGVQYKLQLDGGVPSCRVAGTAGAGHVIARAAIEPGHWHRITCKRRGPRLTLLVKQLENAAVPPVTEQVEATIGSVNLPRQVPLTVGGKVGADDRIVVSATDQFNGVIDNVWFTLLD